MTIGQNSKLCYLTMSQELLILKKNVSQTDMLICNVLQNLTLVENEEH